MQNQTLTITTQPDLDGVFEINQAPYTARIVRPEESCWWRTCQRLRYAYFVRQRGWVRDDPQRNGLEADDYVLIPITLPSLQEMKLLLTYGYCQQRRRPASCWSRKFACLLNNQSIRLPCDASVVELSRLVYCPVPSQIQGSGTHPVELLLKLLYRLALTQGFARFYIVVEQNWIKPFARRFGLTFTPIGIPYIFPDGTRTVGATATLTELQESMKAHSQGKLAWYHDNLCLG